VVRGRFAASMALAAGRTGRAIIKPADSCQAEALFAHLVSCGLSPRMVAPGIVVCEQYAQVVLATDPVTFISDLDARVPKVGRGGTIQSGRLQWVTGTHVDLQYRGNDLNRRKIWIQDGPTDEEMLIYSYTGWNNCIAFATSNWNDDSALTSLCQRHNSVNAASGLPASNHGIVTAYDSEADNIGFHTDKHRSLAPDAGIFVVKMGAVGRRFAIRTLASASMKQLDVTPFFDEVLVPGTLIFMTAGANQLTQHAVPVESAPIGLSGSIVWRTITDRRSVASLSKKAAHLLEERRARKRQRAT